MRKHNNFFSIASMIPVFQKKRPPGIYKPWFTRVFKNILFLIKNKGSFSGFNKWSAFCKINFIALAGLPSTIKDISYSERPVPILCHVSWYTNHGEYTNHGDEVTLNNLMQNGKHYTGCHRK